MGGPPCQPYSVNGDQRGSTDERDCFGIFTELVRRVRPIATIIENVPALVDGSFDGMLDPIVENLESSGFHVRASVHSCAHHSVPQARRRLLLTILRRDAWPEAAPVLDVGSQKREIYPFDALARDSLWTGSCPPELKPTASVCRARERLRQQRASGAVSSGIVTAGRAAPTVLTSCVHNTSYQRLLVVPIDKAVEKLEVGDLRMIEPSDVKLLQSFPAEFQLFGSTRIQGTLLGNAVPPMFSLDVGTGLERILALATGSGCLRNATFAGAESAMWRLREELESVFRERANCPLASTEV